MARRRIETNLEFNMTPMIDVVFLLIVFFMLVTQFASQEIKPMELPKPQTSQADGKIQLEEEGVVQVCLADLNDETSEVVYWWGGRRLGDLDSELVPVLTERCDAFRAENRLYHVQIRIDERIQYGRFHDLMKVLAKAGVVSVFLTAQVNVDAAKTGENP